MPLRAAADEVGRKMMADPEGVKQIEFARELARNPHWKWLTDAFGQPFGGWNAGQYAYLHQLYQFWAIGELAVTRLPIGCTPYADRQRERNQAALNALSVIEGPEDPGVTAGVDADQDLSPYGDGWFTWSNEIVLGMRIKDEPAAEAWAYVNPLGPTGVVPLEIGYTDTQTTYWHLLRGFGLARWPYGSESVILLVPSTAVREAVRADDPTMRWKPKKMWHPSDNFHVA
jgi:hypothetical protein